MLETGLAPLNLTSAVQNALNRGKKESGPTVTLACGSSLAPVSVETTYGVRWGLVLSIHCIYPSRAG
jgi:hypothetical protein